MQKAGPKHSTVRNEVAMTVLIHYLQKQAQSPNKKYTQGRAEPNRSDVQSVQKDTGSKQKVQTRPGRAMRINACGLHTPRPDVAESL
jgi:hypothetical protein